MKKVILALSLTLIATLNSFAQFKISGHIKNFTGTDSLVLNLPFVYGYYPENNITITIDKSGRFNKVIPLHGQKFGTLIYKNTLNSILLTPKKSLVLEMDTTGKFLAFNGTTGNENKELYRAKLNEAPFFLKGDVKSNPYAGLTLAELQQQVVKPWFAIRDEKLRNIKTASIPASVKKLIASEINYQAYVELNYFAHGVIYADKKLVNQLMCSLYDGVSPAPAVFPAGPWYYWYAENYTNYLNGKIFADFAPTDERSKPLFFNAYHMNLDTVMALGKKYGNAYSHWVLIRNRIPKNAAEQYLAQAIWRECRDKDLGGVTALTDEFKTSFPNSAYTGLLQAKLNKLAAEYAQNENNKNIKVFDGYDKVTSIYDVVNAFKGKTIYLDIWGTWCGPCKRELQYNPALKQHFKDKDIVFVYLDMDEDDKDADWKKFIKVNGLTGIHLRKSKADIQHIWDELLAKDKQRLYPTYFIFDKNGKLAQADAKQPSDGAELYTELEKYL